MCLKKKKSDQNIDWLSTIMHAPYNPFTTGIVTTIFTQLQESVCKTFCESLLAMTEIGFVV